MFHLESIPVTDLIISAMEARKKAYAPYSGYMVGAALLTNDLRIYTGCNIENAAFTPGICAERCAISKAVSEGSLKFKAIAIAGSPKGEAGGHVRQGLRRYSYPCGVCRQVMREFVKPNDFFIIVAKSVEEYQVFTLEQLLPESFGGEQLSV